MRKVVLALLLVLGLCAGGYYYFQNFLKDPLLPLTSPNGVVYYQGVGRFSPKVTLLSESVPNISHLEITPDGMYMLATTLPGTIFLFHKVDSEWRMQAEPFFKVKTAQPGWPPQEAGLTGMAFGADFTQSGDIFLTYSYAFEKKSFRNRVMRATFTKRGKKIVGTNPVQIFEAKTPGTGSHQIQDGVGVMISGKPHFMFLVGEGFVAERALNPREEAGKVMLIGRDGSVPVGTRPFPDSPKVQVLGIRNAPAMAVNSKNGMIAIGDTGPNNYDRFIYGKLYDAVGNNNQLLSLNWNGEEESLEKDATDLYQDSKANMILYRWAPSETAVNIGFFDHEKLPPLASNEQYVLVVLFGRTGEPINKPGKQLVLGTLTHGKQPKVTFEPFVERTPDGEGKQGHPLGLAIDPVTKVIYFGDIIEGKIYQVEIE